jgi:hypothetical protein
VLRGKNPTEAVRVVLGHRRSPEKKRRREDVCEFRLVCRGPDVLIYRGHGRIDNRAGRGGAGVTSGPGTGNFRAASLMQRQPIDSKRWPSVSTQKLAHDATKFAQSSHYTAGPVSATKFLPSLPCSLCCCSVNRCSSSSSSPRAMAADSHPRAN